MSVPSAILTPASWAMLMASKWRSATIEHLCVRVVRESVFRLQPLLDDEPRGNEHRTGFEHRCRSLFV